MDVHVHQAGDHPAAGGVQHGGAVREGGRGLARGVAAPDGGDLAAVEHQHAVRHGVPGKRVDDGAAFDDDGTGDGGAPGVVGAGRALACLRSRCRGELGGDAGHGNAGQGSGAGEDATARRDGGRDGSAAVVMQAHGYSWEDSGKHW